ncbi:hypothetical protein D9M71_233600 [compost metagenome]
MAKAVLSWFYESDIINRNIYEYYPKMFARYFQPVVSELMCNDVPEELLSILRSKYPGVEDFSTEGEIHSAQSSA